MRFPSRDLTEQYISLSYQDVVQQYVAPGSSSGYLLDGLGYVILEIPITGSTVLSSSYAVSSSYAPGSTTGTTLYTGSTYDITSSWALTASYISSGSDTIYDGNRAIKRSPNIGLNVGGTTVTQFLDNFFFPFIPATIALNSGTSYYETGSSQNITTNGSITLNDEISLGTGSVKKSGEDWNTFTPTTSSLSYTFTDTGVSSSNTYISYVQVDNNGSPTVINSSTKTISFIFPFLYGLSTSSSLDSGSLYTTLTKSVTVQSDKTINLVGTATYIYFAYPSSYADLSSIVDPNLFNITSDFTQTTMGVTSSGLTTNWMNTYKIYKLNNLADPAGNFQFNF